MAIKRISTRRPSREETDIIGGRVAVHLANGEHQSAIQILRDYVDGLRTCNHWADGYTTADELPLALTGLAPELLNRMDNRQIVTVGDFRGSDLSRDIPRLGKNRIRAIRQSVAALVHAFHAHKSRERKAGRC